MTVRPLSSELQERAEKDLNEVPSRVPEDINYLREWLSKQPHLTARTDDQWLLSFLRCSKYRLEMTKERLDIFYTLRNVEKAIFSKRDPLLPDIQECLRLGIAVVLPKAVYPGGPRVGLIRMKGADSKKLTVESIAKFLSMIFDMTLLTDDNYTVAGGHTIFDLEGVDYNYMAQTIPFIPKAVSVLKSSYPIRVKGIHFINFPSWGETLFNAVKALLPEKLTNRIYVYSEKNIKDLYTKIPLSILPKEYGGDGLSLVELQSNTRVLLESHRNWFLEDDKYISDETKRVGKPKIDTQVFGVEGSFRKLAVD